MIRSLAFFQFIIVFWLNTASTSWSVTLSQPGVGSGVVSFWLDSQADQLLTIQGSRTLTPDWKDVAYVRRTDKPVEFFAPATNEQFFFRVRATPFQPLTLSPSGPILASGSVSLPDIALGQPYFEEISPILTGLPPYSLVVSGTPPTGVTFAVTENGTGSAVVRIFSSGAGLVPNERKLFSVTVVDSLMTTNTRSYDVRVIPPRPQISVDHFDLKAGELVNAWFAATGGIDGLTWIALERLPAGLSLSPEGFLSGTPTAEAAELNENGLYAIPIEVSDFLNDRITGNPVSRKTQGTVTILVRLSYVLNIQATRPGGPSLRQSCVVCHSSDFKPDTSSTALALINVTSGSGAECGTDRIYVAPGDASDSLLYEKLLETRLCGERMPFDGPYLSDQQIGRLARWIRELEPEDVD